MRMDLIYNRSYLTIIAAAEEDPSFGLPGVGKRTRRLRLFTKIRKAPAHRFLHQLSRHHDELSLDDAGLDIPRRIAFPKAAEIYEATSVFRVRRHVLL